jgi:hypothetical protein
MGCTAAAVSDIIHLSPPSAHAVTPLDAHGEYWNPMKVVVLVVAAFVLTTALVDVPVTRGNGRLALAPERAP